MGDQTSMEIGKKRKRETEHPRITYHASERTFDRLFKEKSLSEMKDVARTKLGLPMNTPISLEQIRDGKPIDLEDDDDFDAFSSIAHSISFVNVRVIVGNPPSQPMPTTPMTATQRKERKKKATINTLPTTELFSRNASEPANDKRASTLPARDVEERISFAKSSDSHSGAPEFGGPQKKKRKKTSEGTESMSSSRPIRKAIEVSTSSMSPSIAGPARQSGTNEASTSTLTSAPANNISTAKSSKRKRKLEVPDAESSTESPLERILPLVKKAKKKSKKTTLAHETPPADQCADVPSKIPGINEKANAASGNDKSVPAPPLETKPKKKSKKISSLPVMEQIAEPSSDITVVNERSIATSDKNKQGHILPSENRPKRKYKNSSAHEIPSAKESTEASSEYPEIDEEAIASPDKNKVQIEKRTKKKSARHRQPSETEQVSTLTGEPAKRIGGDKRQTAPEDAYEAALGSEDKDEGKTSAKKTTGKPRSSTVDEFRAAVSKVLAAKRASLSAQPAKEPKPNNVTSSHQVNQPKRIPSLHAILPNLAVHASKSSSSRSTSSPSETRSPERSACQLCLLSPQHGPDRCQLVLGGTESLHRRLAEIQADSSGCASGVHSQVITELNRLLALAQKAREKDVAQTSVTGLASLPNTKVNGALDAPSPSSVHQTNDKIPIANSDIESDDESETSDDTSSKVEHSHEPIAVPPVRRHNSQYAEVDLEELIRGPQVPRLSAADLQSSDSSEDEQAQSLEEDEDERVHKDRSRKARVEDSSDEDDGPEDDLIMRTGTHYQHSPPATGLPRSDTPDPDQPSFLDIYRQGESQEVDISGDVAFDVALAADTDVFKLADRTEAITSPPTAQEDIASSRSIISVQSREASPDMEKPNRSPIVGINDIALESNETVEPVLPQPSDELDAVSLIEGPSQPKEPRLPEQMKLQNGKAFKRSQPVDSLTPSLSQSSQKSSVARTTRASARLQSLSLLTPPPFPMTIGRQSRLIRASNSKRTTKSTTGPTITLSDSQSSMTPQSWAVLKGSSPLPDADTTMIDELQSSSPDPRSDKNVTAYTETEESAPGNEEGYTSPKAPLFIHSETQPSFPYSQWADVSQPQEEDQEDPNDPILNDSQDEIEVETTMQSQTKANPRSSMKYRRLTDIASQRVLFSTPTSLRPARFPTSGQVEKDMYGRTTKEEVESETDTDSDDSTQIKIKSHIPKSRIAGVKRTNKRK